MVGHAPEGPGYSCSLFASTVAYDGAQPFRGLIFSLAMLPATPLDNQGKLPEGPKGTSRSRVQEQRVL